MHVGTLGGKRLRNPIKYPFNWKRQAKTFHVSLNGQMHHCKFCIQCHIIICYRSEVKISCSKFKGKAWLNDCKYFPPLKLSENNTSEISTQQSNSPFSRGTLHRTVLYPNLFIYARTEWRVTKKEFLNLFFKLLLQKK